MASEADRNMLVLMVGTELVSETDMGRIIDKAQADGVVHYLIESAAVVWEIRAAKYHGLVNISESGSTRNMGDLYKNAIAMAAYYRKRLTDLEAPTEEPEETVRPTRTRAVVRP